MFINRLSVLILSFGVGYSPVHATLVVISGCFMMFQDVSGSAVDSHDRRVHPLTRHLAAARRALGLRVDDGRVRGLLRRLR